MTTKGGLENNILKDVALQYKVYVAVRQAFYFPIGTLSIFEWRKTSVRMAAQKPS